MMDCELFPDGWHPKKPHMNREYTGPAKPVYTRTQKPPRYLWIDFGLSAHFRDPNNPPVYLPAHGTDKTAPEFQEEMENPSSYDPFPTDIYYLGNLVRTYFLDVSECLIPRVINFYFLECGTEENYRQTRSVRAYQVSSL